ncbi:SOS response-associated peptidase family protein [Sphingomonas sp. MMS12-HWE2-04]|uniref:SOS response-associated peptidase family protein n=1 Tax=Sphingomonas sp. MMS12-HWE2-04 TaxID=3234199 RepID=UPI00384AEDD1
MEAMPFESDAPLGSRRAIIRRNPITGIPQLISAAWGLDGRIPGDNSRRFIRGEGKTFAHQRCLIPMSEFQVTNGERKFRVVLEDGNHFFFAGVWQPSSGDKDIAYAVITLQANPDVFFYQERHGAVLLRRQNMAWLDLTQSEGELLVARPPRSFLVEEVGPRGLEDRQRRLAL